jgi:hypothetical protein
MWIIHDGRVRRIAVSAVKLLIMKPGSLAVSADRLQKEPSMSCCTLKSNGAAPQVSTLTTGVWMWDWFAV